MLKSFTENHRYVIYAPNYDENIGGAIVLHRLCDLLNRHGVKSCIYPMGTNLNKSKYLRSLDNFRVGPMGGFYKEKYKRCEKFNTPLCYFIDSKNDVVVYPEIVSGNPLGVTKVVRWLLHKPGYFTGEQQYGKNDLVFFFQKAFLIKNGLKNIGGELRVMYMQSAYKNNENPDRKGACYIIRKGAGRELVHNPKNSILIDGRTHKEIAEIFNKTEKCISYDMYTMYSRYAAACGCLSIVVPDPAISKLQWRPEEELRWGVAYGFDDIEWAKSTQDKVLPALEHQEQSANKESIENFIEKCEKYFR